jgi:hypothetical protein
MPKIAELAERQPLGYYLKRLRTKQRAFINEVAQRPEAKLEDCAKDAGYKNPSAAVASLLKNEIVQRAISAIQYQHSQHAIKKGDEVIERLWEMADFDPADIFEDDALTRTITLKQLEEMPLKARRCLTSMRVKSRTTTTRNGDPDTTVEVDIRWPDKLEVAKVLAKALGVIDAEPSSKEGANVTINIAAIRDKLSNPEGVKIVDDDVIDAAIRSKNS